MINITFKDRIAWIKLDRPEKRNALNLSLIDSIIKAVQFYNNEKECRAIIFSSTSDNFCSGADLSYLQSLQSNSYEDNLNDSSNIALMFKLIYQSPKITIAAVDGFALAGGCGIANACDYIFATPLAKFGYTECRIGFIPAIVGIILTRKFGEQLARQLLFSAQIISANTALQMGLIYQIVEKNINEEVENWTLKLIETVSGNSIQMMKTLLFNTSSMGINDAINEAISYNAQSRSTDDCKLGISKFLNKENIKW